MSNTAIWDKVSHTDPAYTKKISGKKFSGTDIKPAYRLKKMTEAFGPAGKGWGYEVQEHWRETVTARSKGNDIPVECVFVMLRVWWSEDGGQTKYFTGSQIGGTETGMAVDEAYKMAITDALGKCLVDLGVCADVYLGEFGNDSKYSRQEQQQPAKPKQDKQPPAKQKSAFDRAMAALAKAEMLDKLTAIRSGIHQCFKNGEMDAGELARILVVLYCKAAEMSEGEARDKWQMLYMADVDNMHQSQRDAIDNAFRQEQVAA